MTTDTPRPLLETERLVLRPFTIDDAPEVARLVGVHAVADTTLTIPHPYGLDDARTWIGTHNETQRDGKGAPFGVCLRDGTLIGAIGLEIDPGHRVAELGYWIAVEHWNHGYATEAVRAILSHAFRDLALRRVHAFHFRRNPASGRVLEKVGMTREGVWRQHILKWDVPEDLILWGLLASEFEST